jgi:hypothetical protein
MAYPLFKLTLSNDDTTSEVFDDYDGWKDIDLILERDKEFHSVVELVETPLIFYGTSKDYLLTIIDTHGIDSIVDVQIDLSVDDGVSYDNIFIGVLALEEYEEVFEGTESYRLTVPILPNEFWQRFINRFDTPVEIGSTTDLDGGTRETINSFTLNLPSQKIITTFNSHELDGRSFFLEGTDDYFQYFPNKIEIDEIETTFSLFSGSNPGKPVNFIDVKYDGVYNFSFKIEASILGSAINVGGLLADNAYISSINQLQDYFFQKNEETPIAFTKTGKYYSSTGVYDNWINPPTTTTDMSSTIYTYDSGDITLVTGDKITIYGSEPGSSDDTLFIWGKNGTESYENESVQSGIPLTMDTTPSEYTHTANTTLDDSTTDAFNIHEAFNSVTDLITGQDLSFYSPELGNTSTQIQTYGSSNEMSYNAVMKGIHVRNYSFADKPFHASDKNLWEGINPIYNFGLGYDTNASSPFNTYIEIREREHFYEKNSHITLSNIEGLVRTVDVDKYIKAIEIGFKKWKSESIGGIDDPQTKRSYATRFKTFGKELKIISSFYGAGLGIEITRRKGIRESEDWKLDDEIVIINLDRTSPTNPDFDDDFSTVTNINNPTLRYNLKLTPARMLLRHMNYLSAGLTKYAGTEFKFVGGEGNYDMTSTQSNASRGDFGGANLAENQDIAWDYFGSPPDGNEEVIFIPETYEFTLGLSHLQFDSFKTNRKRSFLISESESDYKEVFLERLEYNPATATAKFKATNGY